MRRHVLPTILIIAQLSWTSGSGFGTVKEIKELCQFDSFYGRCAADEIIIIEHARYGRMKTGRCISGEGYIGCETDVRAFMEGACAGRRHCNVSVTSLTDVVQPCRKDYTSYLEVAYSCKTVESDALNPCQRNRRNNLTSPTGLLASVVAMETGAGSAQCPWEIHGNPGQQIRLKLIVYRPGQDQEQPSTACPWFVMVEERDQVVSEGLCGRIKSQKVLMVSEKNIVRVFVTWEGRPDHAPVFIVQYEIIGCPDLAVGPASGAVVTRTGEELVVRCLESRETWYLTCSGTSWIGDFNNCSWTSLGSSQKSSASAAGGGGGGVPFPQGLVIAVVLGLILGLFVGSASLAALFLIRRRRQRSRDPHDDYDDDYASEKLRTTDVDPDGYRSTICGYPTGSDLTTTTIDLTRSPRCFAFYSGSRDCTPGTGRPPVPGSTYTGRASTEFMTSPSRMATSVDGRSQAGSTYETTRLGGVGCVAAAMGCPGGGGGGGVSGGGGGCGTPFGAVEQEQDQVQRKGFAAPVQT